MDTPTTISTFLDFYRDRRHARVTGTTLLPPDDDPVLFTSAGMHPLTPYLTGLPHPQGARLVGVQRCLRTTDLDGVGDRFHLTVFQMLGSWSLGSSTVGGYDGTQSLRWGFELLTHGFGVPRTRLHATVFGGGPDVPMDESSALVWSELGVPVELGTDGNWWSNGPTGPCGPDSEIYVWTGSGQPVGTPGTDHRWVEVWNHVLLLYLRGPDGRLRPLEQPNVDTGMGLERLLMVLQGVRSVYETDLLRPWVEAVAQWGVEGAELRVVTDHLRSAVAVAGDGVRPASSGRGYVLRRLLRRSLTALWRRDLTTSSGDLPADLLGVTLDQLEVVADGEQVRAVVLSEEQMFRDLVVRGRRVVERRLRRSPGGLDDTDLTYLHETHGLPAELVVNLLVPSGASG